jgi:hypothetical protein
LGDAIERDRDRDRDGVRDRDPEAERERERDRELEAERVRIGDSLDRDRFRVVVTDERPRVGDRPRFRDVIVVVFFLGIFCFNKKKPLNDGDGKGNNADFESVLLTQQTLGKRKYDNEKTEWTEEGRSTRIFLAI